MEQSRVPLGDVKTHPALQPRDPDILKQRERVRQEAQSELHIHDMALFLQAAPKAELTPLHLAQVKNALYVIDGHHRLKAYRKAKRETVPARVQPMTLQEASHASKLANITHTKLEMLPAQKRNALWHHLAAITQNGTLGLPVGTSQQRLANEFGQARSTLQGMLRRLPLVDHTTFPVEHCDGITKWPHWRHVVNTSSGMYQAMDPDVRLQWQQDRWLKKLVKLVDQAEPEVVLGALRKWRAEETEDEELRAIREELLGIAEVELEESESDF